MHPISPAASVAQINSVVTSLVTAHPEAALRIAQGADLVQAGAVEPTYAGVFLVYSASDPNKAYALVPDRGRWLCDCSDATQRGQGCKHYWAVVIFQACERLDADGGDPTPPVVAFPTPAYDADLDRFELTPKGLAALASLEGNPA
jgi:hypothetical protein